MTNADPTDTPPSALALNALTHGPQTSRWRTEAMRSHTTARLLFFARGQGRITVAGLTSGYGPNNLIFIPAGTMYGFEMGPTVFGQMLTLPAGTEADWPKAPTHLRLRDVTPQKELLGLLEGLERETAHDLPHNLRAAACYAGLLSVFVARQIAARPAGDVQAQLRTDTPAARLVAAFTALIEERFRQNRTIASYAADLDVTATHLTRCCRQTCGKSALSLLSDRRHYEACTMLRDTLVPVQDIAGATGFQSAAYFSRAFQQRTGQSPSAFRSASIKTPRL